MKNWFMGITSAALLAGCGGEANKDLSKESAPEATAVVDAKDAPAAVTAVSGKVLLVTQSTFKQDDKGKYVLPDAAELLIVSPDGDRWKVDRIRDPESNVFHKALSLENGSILTIGGNNARLKQWTKTDGQWKSETLWGTSFGGKQNRLRDMEAADFNGDGKTDLAIATHDQGIVAVAWNNGGSWKIEELDRKAETFVHEIETGDLDGDGKLEIFSTPSEPNTSSGHGQGGEVSRYAWTGEKFEKSIVASFDNRHIKEILVADVDGDAKKELYAVLEAQMGPSMNIEVPVEIYRYDWTGSKFAGKKVVEIPDRFCRFLTAGDIDNDGAAELVASAFSSGIHLIEKNGDNWNASVLDKASGGFEHATWMTDLDGDGKLELYVADDNSGTLRRYKSNGTSFASTEIYKRLVPTQAMVWNITTAEF